MNLPCGCSIWIRETTLAVFTKKRTYEMEIDFCEQHGAIDVRRRDTYLAVVPKSFVTEQEAS